MRTFATENELYTLVTPFLERLMTGDLYEKFSSVGDTVRICYSDPDASFLLDSRQDPPVVRIGDDAACDNPAVQLSMSADIGHKLWLGELNIKKALATRRIKIDGPLMKLLGLLPAFQPAYAEYRTYLMEIGRSELLTV